MTLSPRSLVRCLVVVAATAALLSLSGCDGLCLFLILLTYAAFGQTLGLESSHLAAWFGLTFGGAAGTDELLPPSGLVLEATGDGGHSIASFQRAQTGPADLCVGVSLHKPNKLLPYQSRAIVELVHPGEGGGRRGIEAIAASGGAILVCALLDGEPVGAFQYLEVPSVVLRIVEAADRTGFYVRAPKDPFGEGEWMLVHEDLAPPPAAPYHVEFGGRELGKGGGFVFHALGITGSQLANGAENDAIQRIGAAVLELDLAQQALTAAEPDVDAANECAEAAFALLQQASDLVVEGKQEDAFGPGSKAGKAKKALKHSLGKTKVALKLGDAGSDAKVSSMTKKIAGAEDRAKLAIANLLGSKAKKAKQAGKAFQISAP